jgi:hypothetical protein
LWNEKISISRESIYTSITLFITGAVLLGLGVTVYIFRQFSLLFTYFELFMIVFTLAFFSILIASSGRMRVMIIRFFSVRIFKHKYDYKEQFLRLHQTYISDSNMQQSFTELIENMKYSFTVDDAYIFLLNSENGNYYIHKNPEFATHKELWFSGDSQFVKAFENDNTYLDFAYSSENNREKTVLKSEKQIIHSLDIAAAFPILYKEKLLGLLALNYNLGKKLDYEDIQLIQIFALSIGNVIFKHKMLKASIEQKQFESFNHIASFVIHDIKNQVATLSLISKNSKENIKNPDFQKSLLNSLNGCVTNLQALLDKFTAPLKKEEINLQNENINSIIEKVINDSGIKSFGKVLVESNFGFEEMIRIDGTHLYYIIMNLVKNSLEAMNFSGKITISTGEIHENINKLSKEFQVSENFLSNMEAYIKIIDNGCGMSKKFISEKLFQPFTSTKDKGIGIGLYQCKILIEKMGGKLICQSELHTGTKFCIVLK